jgi:NitT/TauT family transport system ATP-binding protein
MKFVADNIYKEFPGRDGEAPIIALNGVSISVEKREFVCLLGPSGCGKSTLLHILAGLEIPTKGSVYFTGSGGTQQPSAAMVFQQLALYPWMNVIDNVAFPLRIAGISRSERRARAKALITKMRLGGFEGRFPRDLSGGMQQRVAIARALITDPEFMLMDEPFGALDAQTRLLLQEEMLRIWESVRNAIVFVTHSIEEAILLADRVYIFSARPGTIREEFKVSLPRPRSPAVRSSPEFGAMYERIWGILRSEVERSVSIQ